MVVMSIVLDVWKPSGHSLGYWKCRPGPWERLAKREAFYTEFEGTKDIIEIRGGNEIKREETGG